MADGGATGPSIRRFKSKQDYGTPREFLDAVEARFGKLAFDLAASSANAVTPNYFTIADDALKQDWAATLKRKLGWLNPPFERIDKWSAKCAAEAQRGARILFLVPNSTGSNWYWDNVAPHAAVLSIHPRLEFDGYVNPKTGKPEAYPKDLILCAYGVGVTGFARWIWRGHRPRRKAAK
jgi:phage N-6-adenine-methyltransferase